MRYKVKRPKVKVKLPATTGEKLARYLCYINIHSHWLMETTKKKVIFACRRCGKPKFQYRRKDV